MTDDFEQKIIQLIVLWNSNPRSAKLMSKECYEFMELLSSAHNSNNSSLKWITLNADEMRLANKIWKWCRNDS